MKILIAHNYYQRTGGEDVVVEGECKLLQAKNNKIIFYKRENKEINHFPTSNKLSMLWQTSWSKRTYSEVSKIIKENKPDICHVHNMFPLITPSIYYACDDNKVPVVQTIHNYRFFCANGFFFRDNHICEECLNRSTFHSVQYGCYRNSRIQTYSVARMQERIKKEGIWTDKINALICPTEFVYNKFIEGHFPKEKLFIKSNFIFDVPKPEYIEGNYFLYAGRLDYVKGINTLSLALKNLDGLNVKIIGEGAEIYRLRGNLNLEILGNKTHEEAISYIRNCIAVVCPSIWYETFALTIIEAFASGKPVIASRLGAMQELIEDGKTGLLFEPGDHEDLKRKIVWANENKDVIKQMGMKARRVFEEKYTAETNYIKLMAIYKKLLC